MDFREEMLRCSELVWQLIRTHAAGDPHLWWWKNHQQKIEKGDSQMRNACDLTRLSLIHAGWIPEQVNQLWAAAMFAEFALVVEYNQRNESDHRFYARIMSGMAGYESVRSEIDAVAAAPEFQGIEPLKLARSKFIALCGAMGAPIELSGSAHALYRLATGDARTRPNGVSHYAQHPDGRVIWTFRGDERQCVRARADVERTREVHPLKELSALWQFSLLPK